MNLSTDIVVGSSTNMEGSLRQTSKNRPRKSGTEYQNSSKGEPEPSGGSWTFQKIHRNPGLAEINSHTYGSYCSAWELAWGEATGCLPFLLSGTLTYLSTTLNLSVEHNPGN